MKIAIVTGASSGMGREYAKLADASGDYGEIWLIARREERLAALAETLEMPARVLPLDLTRRNAAPLVKEQLEQRAAGDEAFEVGLLVNAAGFGKFGTFEDMGLDEVDDMIDLNCRALVDLTQIALPFMRRGARILEFASSAGFQPLPGLNVYAASKAFVISYTRALRRELHGRGIRITAVCPIWIKTEFVEVARRTANGQTVRHPWPQLSPRRVARWSTLVNKANYPIATCSVFAFLMRIAGKIIPSPLIMWIWAGLRRI
ncbi:MAG: SDR family NAD(P)-dependent oxidoreductase [Coriobacteriales bacterium]|nr:SDR family NAD(P)-dependent oxidoreductase [Coriobacteriaceae bacterium]MDY2723111.1 SDR family NAD(P)-dependent oxidoreductase [Coriobacteriales bacterium]